MVYIFFYYIYFKKNRIWIFNMEINLVLKAMAREKYIIKEKLIYNFLIFIIIRNY